MFRSLLSVAILIGAFAPTARGAEPDALALQAAAILKTHCVHCHGEEFQVEGFDILDFDGLTKSRRDEAPYVIPGDAKKSSIFQRIVRGDMPPKSVTKRPTAEEIETIRAWIAAGAPRPRLEGPTRKPIDELTLLKTIFADLNELTSDAQHFQRYFSLANWHNNPEVSELDLRLYRAGFVKLLNSVSRSSRLVRPVLIDAATPDDATSGLIFRVDLRDVRWDYKTWRQAMRGYPYGISWGDPMLEDLQNKIYRAQGGSECADGVPYIRADWFTAQASRPPIYHTLLDVPTTVGELEKRLGVDFERDFKQGGLCRAAFTQSGVSYGNRAVDRMESTLAQYYWKSYDFKATIERQMVMRFPLGPRFEGNEFADVAAFEHDGGEMIWSMANGMQGYMITDASGERLDEAPVAIVRDLTEISGTPTVVNGLSCMGCHKRGIQPMADQVRESFLLGGEERTKVRQLYGKQSDLDAFIKRDTRRFQDATVELLKPYFGKEADEATIANIEEPVSRFARIYDRDMSLVEVATELGVAEASLPDVIRGNQHLQSLGLGVLAEKGKIPRKTWDSSGKASASVFQRAARGLNVGIPLSIQ
jgi:mono/diheme cytochrome c family protein